MNPTHSKDTFLYAISRTLERASYYGLRSLIVLYMIDGILKIENTKALSIFGWFTAALVFSQIIGALIGDLLIGNKKAVIIGGLMQSLGAFALCIPSYLGLYIGLFLVVLGGGLYSPNIISNFGKLYLNKTKLLDAGFTLFYIAVNVGSVIGVLSIGYFGENYGWNIGFVIIGITMLLSIVPIIFSKDAIIESIIENKTTLSKQIINVSIAFLSVNLFWFIYELSNIQFGDLQLLWHEALATSIPISICSSIDSFYILPLSLITMILWTYFYSTQFFKLMLGFIFGTISFAILLVIAKTPDEQHIVLYLISLLFLGISEIHIAPIIHSVLTQYTPPKYLAIIISLAFIPTRIFSFIIAFFNEDLVKKPIVVLFIMIIFSLGLIAYHQIHKKQSEAVSDQN